MPELFDKHGGFRRLHSFTLATIVQIETLRFCRRFLTFNHNESATKFYDPKGRQYDQMTQAARSGRQNIIEGSERSSTSKNTEMKLTDVARASLSELRGDYEIFIIDRHQLPWSVHSAEAKAVNAISLDTPPFKDDLVHESAKHALEQRKKYARWLDSDDATVVANAMLIIIGRALNILKKQVHAQGRAFEATGGFNERLMSKRLKARDKNKPPAPGLPPMRQTHAPAPFGQRLLLGLLRLPRLHRHTTHRKQLTIRSTPSIRSTTRGQPYWRPNPQATAFAGIPGPWRGVLPRWAPGPSA